MTKKPLDSPISLLKNAIFQFRTFQEATLLSNFLAQTCPKPVLTDIALSEIFMNAIEHGNLELSYQLKTQLQKENRWLTEIEHRLTLPEYKHKVVTLAYTRTSKELIFKITDQGKGFDWQNFKKNIPQYNEELHGRGLAIIQECVFHRIEYQGKGNEVICTINLN
jgi:anti-sigma regulatory factor (Ser/Thr protein kinase)